MSRKLPHSLSERDLNTGTNSLDGLSMTKEGAIRRSHMQSLETQ